MPAVGAPRARRALGAAGAAGGAAPGDADRRRRRRRRASIRETADFEARELGAEVFGWNLPNWLLRREMVARLGELPGAELARRRAGRAGDAADRRGARGALGRRPRCARALVVAADGRDSAVREALGIGARRWGYGQKALVFTVTHALPHDGVSTEIHRSGGPVHAGAAAGPATARTPRRWSGWRRGRGRRSWRRCRRTPSRRR